MEDIKRRLELNSPAIKSQAIRRVLDQIVKRKDQTLITEASTKITELEFLWDKCGDVDICVCHAACQALVQLATHYRSVEYNYVLNRLLNLAPSAQNLSGTIKAVVDLLVFQLLVTIEQHQSYKTPFSIRVRPHPLVTLVTNRPDCWPLILEQVNRLLSDNNNVVRENAMELLSPLLKFVLLEPNQSIQFTQLRIFLPISFLQRTRQDSSLHYAVINWFLKLVPALQVKSAANIGEVAQFLQLLIDHVGNETLSDVDRDNHLRVRLVQHVFTMCQDATRHGLDSSALIELLETLSRKRPECVAGVEVVAHCVKLLSDVPCHTQLPLLNILIRHLETLRLEYDLNSYGASTILYGSCIRPLLVLTMFSDNVEINALAVGKKASESLQLLEKMINQLKNQRIERDKKDIGHDYKAVSSNRINFLIELCHRLSCSPRFYGSWLETFAQSLNNKTKKWSSELVSVLCSAFLVGDYEDSFLKKILSILQKLSKYDHAQSILLLPVLLYKMNRTNNAETKVAVLHTIPMIATSKVSVNLILRTLQHLGGSPSLKALSIRLMTKLWQQQDRCFPYLYQCIVEKDFSGVSAELEVNEVALAKAASIRDVCKYRPYDHGKDMVAPISNLLNAYTCEQDAPIISLALEGLFYLCEAEEIDVKTAWSVLAAKLSKDNRPLVVRGVCQLLSLVPSLAEQNASYQKFTGDVIDMIWSYANDWAGDPLVVKSAFRALAKFEPQMFQMKNLPKQITGDLLAEAISAAEGLNPDDVVIPPVSGKCYIDLLKALPVDTLEGYEDFLESLVSQEVTNIPRGIQHSAIRRNQTNTSSGKALQTIPSFISTQYEKNRQPGMRPALAVGLLFSYDPQLEVGRDGKPRRNHIAQLGRQYHRMLYTLMNEVPIQPSDWYRCSYTPTAWTSFMDRCYNAYVQCRVAELQLKLHSGEETLSPEENKLFQDTAWLWARDKLVDLIKSSSKGSPSVQGNAVCALAGLAVASCKYAASLDDAMMTLTEQVPEHMGQPHWMTMACNTLMAIVDQSYQPQGRIFAMCGQRNDGERSPVPVLARSSAALALSQLIRPLISLNADLVYKILSLLSARLPKEQLSKNEESEDSTQSEVSGMPGVVEFHHGLAIGWVIWSLFEEKFLDVSGSQGMIAVWKSVGDLEASAFGNSDNRTGSLLGLSVALSAMCKDGKPDTKVHVCGLHERLTNLLQSIVPTDTAYDALCLCLASVAASGYAANVLPQASVDQTVASIYQAHIQQPENLGACAALGTACFGLLVSEHPTVKDLAQKLFTSWLSQLQDPEVSASERVSILLGITSLSGSCNSVFQMENVNEIGKHIDQADLISCLKSFASTSDLSIASAAPWLLGQLYLASFDISESKSSVPSSYNYLDDTSILKAIIQLLIEAGKSGPEVLSPRLVSGALRALVQGTNQALPPLNWASIFSPLMRMTYGDDIETLCLQMAVKQSQGSPSAAMFLSSWLLSPLYDSLSEQSHLALFDSLATLVKTVPHTKLDAFLTHHVLTLFQNESKDVNLVAQERALWGLLGALKVNDPPQSVTFILYQSLEKLYNSAGVQHSVKNATIICEALREIPDSVVDKITEQDFLSEDCVEHAMFTRCYLIGCGSQPFTWLNTAIEAGLTSNERLKNKMLQLVYQCLLSVKSCKGDNASPSLQSIWLLELMGHTKNVAKGIIEKFKESDEDQLGKITAFMIGLFSAAIVAFSQSNHISIGRSPFTVPSMSPTEEPLVLFSSDVEDIEAANNLQKTLFSLLPEALNNLVQVEPWKQMLNKIIDWLLILLESSSVKKDIFQSTLQECLYSLRHNKEYMKMAIWTRAFSSC